MKQIIELFKCGKCFIGKIKRHLKQTRNGVDIKIHKCDNCKYQYGLKEANTLTIIDENNN